MFQWMVGRWMIELRSRRRRKKEGKGGRERKRKKEEEEGVLSRIYSFHYYPLSFILLSVNPSSTSTPHFIKSISSTNAQMLTLTPNTEFSYVIKNYFESVIVTYCICIYISRNILSLFSLWMNTHTQLDCCFS